MMKAIAPMTSASPTTPPTTPPAIAATWWFGVGDAVGPLDGLVTGALEAVEDEVVVEVIDDRDVELVIVVDVGDVVIVLDELILTCELDGVVARR